MPKKITIQSSTAEYLKFITSNGKSEETIELRYEDDNIWMTQKMMAELYGVSVPAIKQHLNKLVEDNELNTATIKQYLTVQKEGSRSVERLLDYYNLQTIISVGFKIENDRAVQFRKWAREIVKDYTVKGFSMDDDRLKNLGGGNYWQELLERIRDIRTSEKVFYRQILEIYATSIDYDPKVETSIEFFKKVQNKMHYAVHGQTAAEVIYNRADSEKEFMGLTTFTGTKPQLKDVTVAKNYLNSKELRALGQIVSGYLDFAQRQAERENPMKMEDWAKHLDAILTSTGEQLLQNAGKISHEKAIDKATLEYKKYQQKTLSDVEKAFLESIQSVERKTKST
jgi:hypothetical protein